MEVLPFAEVEVSTDSKFISRNFIVP